MKIGIIQCDVVSGDLSGNAAILARDARACAGADICLAPAFALSGPVGSCIRERADFLALLRGAEERLSAELAAGPPLLYRDWRGYRLLQNGLPVAIERDFYLSGRRIAVQQAESGRGDIVLASRATPFVGRAPDYGEIAECAGASLVCVANLVGGYDGSIYAGESVALNAAGRVCACLAPFRPGTCVVDEGEMQPADMQKWHWETAVWEALVLGLRDFVLKCGARQALLGLSGGMDSALVAVLAARALGAENVVAILMPSPWTSEYSRRDARALARNLGIELLEAPIGKLMEGFEETLAPVYGHFDERAGDVTRENIQARIRGNILAAAANRSGALVLNTGNKSEAAMGYFTLYGDAAGALAVIGDLYKTQVYALGRHANEIAGREVIPQNIFDREPSAELAPDQKDSDSLPPYDELDGYLRAILAGEDLAGPALAVRARMFATEFKRRQCPPALVVSETPLGGCARPIAGRLFKEDA